MSEHQKLTGNGFDYLLFPSEGTAKSLIVLFHGNGANAINIKRWIGIVRAENKDADIISIEGPVLMDISAKVREKYNIPPDETLRSWFQMESIWGLIKHLSAYVFNRVALFRNLNGFIDARLAERSLQDDRLLIAGLSLGGIVAGHTALARSKACAGLVLSATAVLPGLRVRTKPQTLVVIGTEDKIFYGGKTPKNFLVRQFARATSRVGLTHAATVKRLQKRSVPLEARVYADMPHLPSDEAYAYTARFMAQRLG